MIDKWLKGSERTQSVLSYFAPQSLEFQIQGTDPELHGHVYMHVCY